MTILIPKPTEPPRKELGGSILYPKKDLGGMQTRHDAVLHALVSRDMVDRMLRAAKSVMPSTALSSAHVYQDNGVLSVSPTEATFVATDCEQCVSVTERSTTRSVQFKPGRCLLSRSTLRSINKLHADSYELLVDDGKLYVNARHRDGMARLRFPVEIDLDDFPAIPEMPWHLAAAVPGIMEAMAECLPFRDSIDGRYAMSRVWVDLKAGNVVASDGCRIHLVAVPFPNGLVGLGDTFTLALEVDLTDFVSGPTVAFLDRDNKRFFVGSIGDERPGWWCCSFSDKDGMVPPYMDVLPDVKETQAIWRLSADDKAQLVRCIKKMTFQRAGSDGRRLCGMDMTLCSDGSVEIEKDDIESNHKQPLENKEIEIMSSKQKISVRFDKDKLLDLLAHPRLEAFRIVGKQNILVGEGENLRHVLMNIQVG
jgi:hypothetical protein